MGKQAIFMLECIFRKHELFERDGEDLYCEAPVNIVTAILGGEITIPTLEGDVKIKIPKGTQTGKRFSPTWQRHYLHSACF